MAAEHETHPAERFYYADGKKVPLIPSSHFVAVRAGTQEGGLSSATAALAESLTTSVGPGRVLDIPEYNLLVVEVPGGRAATATPATEAVHSLVAAQPGLSAGPSVYETPESPPQEGLIVTGEILVKFQPGATEEDRRKLLDKNNLEVRRPDYPEPDSYLVATKGNQDAVAIANRLHESALVEHAAPNFIRLMPRLASGNGNAIGTYPGTSAPADLGMPGRNVVLESAAGVEPAAPPTDPGYASQWGLRKIMAPEAFDISMGNPAVSIAVIDEGCNLTHEDIVYRLPGYDAVTGTNNPEPQPSDGHGTSCAGIVAATANNGRGGSGVAPNCKILPIRIARGAGGGWFTTDAMIADGIRTAVTRGADVLSNSWGGGAPSTAITSAFQFAQTDGRGHLGCPIAIATGNQDVRGVSYPANLSPTIPGLLAVGASNEWDQRKSRTSLDGETWWGSNYGPEVDVVAPGVHIYTTDIMGAGGYSSGNYIPNFNGTSSATPHVAGLMALLVSVDPGLRSWEVEDIIKLTANDLGAPGRDEEFGFGRINCRRALEAVSRIWYEISVVPEFLGSGQDCYMRIRVRMYNPGINTVRLDSLTLTSHTSDWSAEIDRFEYRPNPGGIMAPRVGNDLRLNGILLKANGNRSSWTYRWSIGWTYTFWRPSVAGFPMAAPALLTEADGIKESSNRSRGGADMPLSAGNQAAMLPSAADNGQLGDTVTIDRQTKAITIVIR